MSSMSADNRHRFDATFADHLTFGAITSARHQLGPLGIVMAPRDRAIPDPFDSLINCKDGHEEPFTRGGRAPEPIGDFDIELRRGEDTVDQVLQNRKLAADIPGAEFVLLESGNHVLLEAEAAWSDFFNEIGVFTRRKDIR